MILFNYFLIIIINVLINLVFMYRDRYIKLQKELEDFLYEKNSIR